MVERMSPSTADAQAESLDYATRLLKSFVAEHFPHNPHWRPQTTLIGVLMQIDNATTIIRDYKERLRAYEGSAPHAPDGAQKPTVPDRAIKLIRQLAWYYDVNDRRIRPNGDALEVPILDLCEAKRIALALKLPTGPGYSAPTQADRAPKVRTSHHRNKEEATRLQTLVDERYAREKESADTTQSVPVPIQPSTASSGDAQLSDPHPHWSADNTNENYPKSLEEWDPHKDPVGEHLARAERRLRIAMDRDDPRAPAEMTLISRWDLTTLVHDWWTKCAVFDMWRAAGLEKRGEYDHSPAYPRTRRDEIARIIDPVAFSALERSHIVPQNDEFMGMRIARDKADRILALPYSADTTQPPLATDRVRP